MQDKRKEAQRIALQAASKLMGASRLTENMGGGIRKVMPSGVATAAGNADAQAALIMAAQSAASKIAGSMGVRQSREHAMKMQVCVAQNPRNLSKTVFLSALPIFL